MLAKYNESRAADDRKESPATCWGRQHEDEPHGEAVYRCGEYPLCEDCSWALAEAGGAP